MGVLVIGDLHGQVEVLERAVATGHKLAFIGDYLDSFTRPIADQLAVLDRVIQLSRAGTAVALMGNHEMSYISPRMRCSGYNAAMAAHVLPLEETMRKTFKDYIFLEGFLLSHAGVSETLLEDLGVSLEEYLENGNFMQIGYARGGKFDAGGLYWCDWRQEFQSLPNVRQVVGHTRGTSIRSRNGDFCIDCLEDSTPQGLFIEAGNARILDF